MTWKHPVTKQAHMIDFVIMRKEQDRSLHGKGVGEAPIP